MRKKRNGFLTITCLGLVAFLVILCGAWLRLMTQESTNVSFDQKHRRATYAAEAGFMRARRLLVETEGDLSRSDVGANVAIVFSAPTGEDSVLSFINMVDLTVVESTADNMDKRLKDPYYAVFLQGPLDDELTKDNIVLGEKLEVGREYLLTSVGWFMGERKVISKEILVKSE